MSTDTTPDAAAHADAIKEHVLSIWDDHPEDDETLLPKVLDIKHHLAALDAARIAAEQRVRAWQWYAETIEGDYAGHCNIDYPEGYDHFASDMRDEWRSAQDPDVAKWLPNVDGTLPGDLDAVRDCDVDAEEATA